MVRVGAEERMVREVRVGAEERRAEERMVREVRVGAEERMAREVRVGAEERIMDVQSHCGRSKDHKWMMTALKQGRPLVPLVQTCARHHGSRHPLHNWPSSLSLGARSSAQRLPVCVCVCCVCGE